jgi:pyruvate kinase
MTKIISTIRDLKQAKDYLEAGSTALRLNSSHMEVKELINLLKEYSRNFNGKTLYIDLMGQNPRLGSSQKELLLRPGQQVRLTADASESDDALLLESSDFLKGLSSGSKISIDDGKIMLEVVSVSEEEAQLRVLRGGTALPRKSIVSSTGFSFYEGLTKKDTEVVLQTRQFKFVRYALSYVAFPSQMRNLRKLAQRPVAAKIELPLSLKDLKQIAQESDEIWFCRGDLGAQLSSKELAYYYRSFVGAMKEWRVPVYIAGQVLEHMVEHPQPTRSEVCHLADLMAHGFTGVVLSNETVDGKFPLEAIKVVKELAE